MTRFRRAGPPKETRPGRSTRWDPLTLWLLVASAVAVGSSISVGWRKEKDVPPQRPADEMAKKPAGEGQQSEKRKDPEPKPAEDKHEGPKEIAKWLLGGFAVLTAALTTLGAAQGGLERLLRNYPVAAVIALVLGAISLLLVGIALLRREEKHRRGLLVASLLVFTLALVIAVSYSALTPSTREQPFVAAKVVSTDRGLVLEATVKAAGLRSDENIRIVVHPMLVEEGAYEFTGLPLYDADIGPDSAGKVEVNLQLPLEPDKYRAVDVVAGVGGNLGASCFDPNRDAGCLVIKLPPPPVPTPTPSPTLSPTGGAGA